MLLSLKSKKLQQPLIHKNKVFKRGTCFSHYQNLGRALPRRSRGVGIVLENVEQKGATMEMTGRLPCWGALQAEWRVAVTVHQCDHCLVASLSFSALICKTGMISASGDCED